MDVFCGYTLAPMSPWAASSEAATCCTAVSTELTNSPSVGDRLELSLSAHRHDRGSAIARGRIVEQRANHVELQLRK